MDILGKHGQLTTSDLRKIIVNMSQFVNYQHQRDIELRHYRLLSPHLAMLNYRRVKHFLKPYKHGSLLIAALTTAKGRIMLAQLVSSAEKAGFVI